VVIDDDSDPEDMAPCARHWIKVYNDVGLQDEQVQQAISGLTEPLIKNKG
jgi:hypothetical protein